MALLALGALIVVAGVAGVFASTDHTGVTIHGDTFSAPKVMVHADHPTLTRNRCAWNAAAGSLRICHTPSPAHGLIYQP